MQLLSLNLICSHNFHNQTRPNLYFMQESKYPPQILGVFPCLRLKCFYFLFFFNDKTKEVVTKMSLRRISRVLFCWVFCIFCFTAQSQRSSSGVFVRFLQVPSPFSNQKSATFVFEALDGGSRDTNCSQCSFSCQLDDGISSNCEDRNASFLGLQDGHHSFMVCANASQGADCSSYNWTVDTIPPTAYVTATESYTNAVNVSVNISFSEPCSFGCLSVNSCNLLVYGSGQVIPQSLAVLEPNLTYSLTIALSSSSLYGRAILIMDKSFCEDAAGNIFTRTEKSNFTVHFDRRNVNVSLRTWVPEKLVELNGQTRTAQATNDGNMLKVYLYFSQPVWNTSDEILSSLNSSHGSLQPIHGKNLSSRRFGYLINDIPNTAVVTVDLTTDMIISREGNRVPPVAPVILLYDSERPGLMLSTISKMRTKEKSIPVSIRFTKPVFGFNSTQVSISGGHIHSFHKVNGYYYAANIEATDGTVYIRVLENVTSDVAGNKNLPSNVLQVRHYSVPVVSIVLGYFVTVSFLATCFVSGLLTVSSAILLSAGALSRSPPSLTSDPTRNLIRIACYIQVFALSRWLVMTPPIEYYELTACLKWSIPYFNLPWENEHHPLVMFSPASSSSKLFSTPRDKTLTVPTITQSETINKASVVYGAPLTATEYSSFFASQSYVPQAEYVPDPQYLDGWLDFKRSMFWLAVIIGGFIVLHVLLLLILKLRDYASEKRRYGALVFPRFEIFLIILSIPCICKASVSIIKGGTRLGTIVGVLLLLFTCSFQLALFIFLSFGITLGKLLQYKEVHHVGQKFHWYQELIRVTLGPGKRGQWTWKDEPNSTKLTQLGPLFEDLRGPPKYMLSQFSTNRSSLRQGDRIIASDDETEDAEAPFIQKLFGILRIYYTLLESLKRFSLGVAATLVFVHPSKGPTVILLCITSFQLFFIVLKKPFIKKKVQLVEIISIACQVGVFAILMAILNRDSFTENETGVGLFMISFFVVGYLALLMNELYALWKQIKKLDTEENRFRTGLRRALLGLLLFFFPEKLIKKLDKKLLETSSENRESRENTNGRPTSSGDTYGSSGSMSLSGVDKATWVRQIREMARAGFPESSSGNSRWSRFLKRSGSSSMSSSIDHKAKSKSKSGGLYKDLEAIFAASTSTQPGSAGNKS